MRKFFRSALISFILCLFVSGSSLALTIGTFNIEYFNASGKKKYEVSDMNELAKTIKRSGADVLALQEIEGDATMRFFVTKSMGGWKYIGNDTNGSQDLYFLWNPEIVTLIGTPMVCFPSVYSSFENKKYKVFDRPPFVAKFRENSTGKEYTLVNVHLKSQSTAGKKDKESAERYNNAKRAVQFEKLNELSASLEGPAFILGDYNHDDAPYNTDFPLLYLESGYSYDNMKSNLDFIGYVNIDREELGTVKETESHIERRSTKKKDHPDHDIITVEIN